MSSMKDWRARERAKADAQRPHLTTSPIVDRPPVSKWEVELVNGHMEMECVTDIWVRHAPSKAHDPTRPWLKSANPDAYPQIHVYFTLATRAAADLERLDRIWEAWLPRQSHHRIDFQRGLLAPGERAPTQPARIFQRPGIIVVPR